MWAIATGHRVCGLAHPEQARSRSCVGTDRTDDRRDLDHRAVGWPGGAVISSFPAHPLLRFVHSTSPAPAGWRTRVAGGAEEPLLARRIRSSKRRRQDAYAAPRRRRTRARSRRLSVRLRERLSSPARTPRCRSSSNPITSHAVVGTGAPRSGSGSAPPEAGCARQLPPQSHPSNTFTACFGECWVGSGRRTIGLVEAGALSFSGIAALSW